MLGLFKKKRATAGGLIDDEDPKVQKADLQKRNAFVASMLLDGCEELPGANGPFGSEANPIPVNGPGGEIVYLNRLLTESHSPLMYHRLGSKPSQLSPQMVDIFEVLSADGSVWCLLWFSMYHPRRSRKLPEGFTCRPLPRSDMERIYMKTALSGVMDQVDHFPSELPNAIRGSRALMGLPPEMIEDMALKIEETLASLNIEKRPFELPELGAISSNRVSNQ